MSKRNKDKTGICAFCGAEGKMTKDHVPLRNLFAGFSDDGLIKVPSCNKCNGETKLDDEYFRAFLIPQDDIATHHQAKKLNEIVRKKFDESESKGLEMRMNSQLHIKELYTPAGIYLGKRELIYPEYPRIDRILKKILKGLYFHLIKRPFPSGFFHIAVVERSQIINLQTVLKINLDFWVDELTRYPINNIYDVFSYKCAASANSSISAWSLTFFEKREFFGITYPMAFGNEIKLTDSDPNEAVVLSI